MLHMGIRQFFCYGIDYYDQLTTDSVLVASNLANLVHDIDRGTIIVCVWCVCVCVRQM